MKKIKLFNQVNIETFSYCNRACSTCLRETDSNFRYDGKQKIQKYLDSDIVYKIIDELKKMKHFVPICFNFFNEPLADKRTPEFVNYANKAGFQTHMNSNADYLNDEIAKQLDGKLNYMNIALYDLRNKDGKERELMVRTEQISKMFKKTKLNFLNDQEHIITHFEPHKKKELNRLIEKYKNAPCTYECQWRLLVTYTGEMVLCCEDIQGNWDLGNIRHKTINELWFSDKHQEIVKTLSRKGGRGSYEYCQSCPMGIGSFLQYPHPNKLMHLFERTVYFLNNQKKKIKRNIKNIVNSNRNKHYKK